MHNFIEKYENAYSTEFCNKIIESFEASHKLGRVFTSNKIDHSNDTRIVYDAAPNMATVYFNEELASEFYRNLQFCYNQYVDKYHILKISAPSTPKGMQIQRTGPGEGYHAWHCETMNLATSVRQLAYMLYLNDVEEGGGDTEFLYQGLKFQPKAGTMMIWPAGFTHPHRGNPIYKGYKYIITGWITYDQ